jgi:putative selenium metabolism protein SsnA
MRHRHRNKSSYAVGGGVVTDGIDLFISDGAILIQGDRITAVGGTRDIRAKLLESSAESVGDEFIDVHGRLIVPGLLNPHQHLYSFLATGLGPVGPEDSFTQQLENLWWRLDKVHDEESVYYSALAGAVDSVKHGVTTIFDHHASMGWVLGSLATVAKAFETLGIKGVLCYETSDRMGRDQINTHIDENLSFWESHRGSETLQASFGLHANFTLSDESLKEIARVKPDELPIHIHCGEDSSDLDYCRELGYQGPVHRLEKFGLLDDRSVLAHAIHLSEQDYRILKEIHPIVVSNPESNAKNQVGRMDRGRISEYVLGTDGMSGDILKTLRSHYLLGEGRKESLEKLREAVFSTKAKVQQKYFPDAGTFGTGAKADIAVLDYTPLTPITLENLMGHLIFGAKGGKVFMTVSDGVIIYRDGVMTSIDEESLVRKAQKTAERLHRRYYG